VEIQLNVSLNLELDVVLWSDSRSGGFTPTRQIIQTAKHTSSAHVCCCFTCTHLNVIHMCFMMDTKVGPNCGKLTQLLDMLEAQKINMLLQFTVHSSVRYTLDRIWKNRRMSSFMLIRPIGELFHVERGTDRRTDMTELIVDLRNFANVPNS
jgi:hypothetical protein